MKNKNLEFVKELASILSNRVFDTFEGLSIMFGDSTNHYSWFPGPGEIRLNVYVGENELNFLLDSVSLKAVNVEYVESFQKALNEAIEVGKALKAHFALRKSSMCICKNLGLVK